jgi:glycosyltransferase involved in cell wall biosynthesis
VHVGGGRLAKRLRRQADRLGIAGRITWRGPLAQAEVIQAYRAADLFVLASRVAGDGDRDGLPNVLMEAQSQALACLSTRVAGIPEVIEDGATGRLVAPGDTAGLAAALQALIRDPQSRSALGQAGAIAVRHRFDCHAGIERLAARLGRPQPRAAAAE